MEPNWAAEHLQVIRTLMERTAIYRRALTPTTLFLGVLGLVAAAIGWFLEIQSGPAFGGYWMGISLVGLSGAYFVVRRQALKDAEPFWSPPTRRVTQAVLPCLFAGLASSALLSFGSPRGGVAAQWLTPVWMVLYGCALHAAGFFMPRGIKLFGWGFILSGCGFGAGFTFLGPLPDLRYAHLIMGFFFGGAHLAYGAYLYFTETRKNAA